jgi:hypothetical protein
MPNRPVMDMTGPACRMAACHGRQSGLPTGLGSKGEIFLAVSWLIEKVPRHPKTLGLRQPTKRMDNAPRVLLRGATAGLLQCSTRPFTKAANGGRPMRPHQRPFGRRQLECRTNAYQESVGLVREGSLSYRRYSKFRPQSR